MPAGSAAQTSLLRQHSRSMSIGRGDGSPDEVPTQTFDEVTCTLMLTLIVTLTLTLTPTLTSTLTPTLNLTLLEPYPNSLCRPRWSMLH